MDASAGSDCTDKPWNRSWTTDEMREKRAEWNLAGDAGLLNHLQQFSDKLMKSVNETQTTLDSLTAELEDTIIFIDNVTNTSLALANTQFIESRVCDDEIDDKSAVRPEPEETKTKDRDEAEMIASIAESVRQGIVIMEEKYETLEVVASDSDDDGEYQIPSVILRPKDPYQDRPLPYVIGSEKWKSSSKIGIETSSSSESEQQDDDESESESDDNKHSHATKIILQNPRIARLSSSSSDSNDIDVINAGKTISNKQSHRSEDLDSGSEISTAANSLPKNGNSTAPNFAEELAKRLGSVVPPRKSVNAHLDEDSIVVSPKDDLFQTEDDLFVPRSHNFFSTDKGLFDDESSNFLWHDKATNSFESGVIPSAREVPPPISNVSSKPKSAIDDLFGDVDSEDTDDIFSIKPAVSKSVNNIKSAPSGANPTQQNAAKNLLTTGALHGAKRVTTSTPETNNADKLFPDDESEDADNLFGRKKNNNDWTGAKESIFNKTGGSTAAGASGTNNRKKPPGGVSILGGIDILSSGKFRRPVSSESSGNISSSDSESSKTREPAKENGGLVINNNQLHESQGLIRNTDSGISDQRPSIDVTIGPNISRDFQPQMTSTLNKPDDMYRERLASDSLFTTNTLNRDSGDSLNNARIDNVAEAEDSDLFDRSIDDDFGPPPLPKAGSKSEKKSKVNSLFDDSDSGDDLFSNVSGKVALRKPEDTQDTRSQHPKQSKPFDTKGLFDDEDADADDDDDDDDDDLFSPSFGKKTDSSRKIAPSLFDDVVDDLFSIPIKLPDKVEDKPQAGETMESEKSATEPKKSPAMNKVNSELMERLTAKLKATKTEEKVVSSETKSVKIEKIEKNEKKKSIFDDVEDDDLFSGKKRLASTSNEAESVTKTTDNVRTKPEVSKKPEILKKIVQKERSDARTASLSVSSDKIEEERSQIIQETRIISDESQHSEIGIKQLSTKDNHLAAKLSRSEETSGTARREPPKTLEIKSSSTTSSSEKTSSVQRRVVSGKIKNLMGRMSDLKILSPTDTPPLLRKNDEKIDDEDDRDSEDGSCLSTSKESPTISEELPKPPVVSSPTERRQLEPAISFDDPVQVETLSVTASKSRVRIQSKRRPQSRHARQNALRTSGIDFDSIDFSNNNDTDRNRNLSNSTNNNPASLENSTNSRNIVNSTSERLITSSSGMESVQVTVTESNSSTFAENRSELSFSKESSLSVNKTTLLSPSTDEEDLFDVPPDLPEDPPREDSLFGRAPILSPVESFLKVQRDVKQESRKTEDRMGSVREQSSSVVSSCYSEVSNGQEIFSKESLETEARNDIFGKETSLPGTLKTTAIGSQSDSFESKSSSSSEERISHLAKESGDLKIRDKNEDKNSNSKNQTRRIRERKVVANEPVEEKLNDPLRDDSFDPLEDPSHLFAFVKKTPSPVKGKNLLFEEDDDGLFSDKSKITSEGRATRDSEKNLSDTSKVTLDLFADDVEDDLFSATMPKTSRLNRKEKNIDLFGNDDDDVDDDDGESLFGGSAMKTAVKSHVKEQLVDTSRRVSKVSDRNSKQASLFDDMTDEYLFPATTKSETKSKTVTKKASVDTFSDHQSTEISSTSKSTFSDVSVASSKMSVKDIFDDCSSDEGDIFAARNTILKKSSLSSELFGGSDNSANDDVDIFGKSRSLMVGISKTVETRGVVKKATTRDLKATAEKIIEDPLSMLQKD